MQIYLVGGAVRDQLMNKPVKDRDWVVVGGSVQSMLEQGFLQVGADFPVFLHPQTQEEYALARVERKSGVGYHGFLVGTENVTLEDDLMRRDLSINAMAQTVEGELIDPHGGLQDLQNQVLRHVGPAFVEDPVRVLRVMRFLARFGPGWTIHPDTASLMRRMVQAGELSHLTAERVWKELSRGIMEPHAPLMVQALRDFGLLELPAFRPYRNAATSKLSALAHACEHNASLGARCALAFTATKGPLLSDAPSGSDGLTLVDASIPKVVTQAAFAWRSLQGLLDDVLPRDWSAKLVYDWLHLHGGLRNSSAVAEALEALSSHPTHHPVAPVLQACWKAALEVDTKAITASMPPGPQVGRALEEARVQAIALALAMPTL